MDIAVGVGHYTLKNIVTSKGYLVRVVTGLGGSNLVSSPDCNVCALCARLQFAAMLPMGAREMR